MFLYQVIAGFDFVMVLDPIFVSLEMQAIESGVNETTDCRTLPRGLGAGSSAGEGRQW